MNVRIGMALLVLGSTIPAANAHAESPKERAAKLMKKLATDKKAEVRAEAAKELGDMGAWDAVPALSAALKDASANVRAGAAYALVKLEDKARDAAPALKDSLHDSDRLVRYNAVVALHNMEAASPAELAQPMVSLFEGADKDDLESVASMLVSLGFEDATARKTILTTIEQGEDAVRERVMLELWRQDSLEDDGPWKADVVRQLSSMVTDDQDAKIRRQAVTLLWQAKDWSGPAGEALLKALDDPDAEVAKQAAGTLNGIERSPLPKKAVAHLTQKLKSPDPVQRARAARALGGLIGRRDEFTPLLTAALLGDKEPAVRLAAVDGLDGISDDNAIPALLKALKTDSDPAVRTAICKSWSVSQVKMRFARTNTLQDALATLEAASADPNPRVKAAAESALEELRR